MARFLLGTSGYYYRDWRGAFYPEKLSCSKMLSYYAERFAALELNFAYYGIPRPKQLEVMAAQVPEGFSFVVKTHKSLTHERGGEDFEQLHRAFLEALRGLEASGKFGGLLAQFPFSFQKSPENQGYLKRLPELFAGRALFVEFRHRSWFRPATYALLKRHQLTLVAVDEPEIASLPPRALVLTSETGYLRFHSREASRWYGPRRYDYDYSPEELSEWLPKITPAARELKTFYIFFNNCFRAAAARNAQALGPLLQEAGLATAPRPVWRGQADLFSEGAG